MKPNKTIRSTYVTTAFRLSYPQLFEAKPDLSNRMRYSCSMLFPKAEVVAKMKQTNHPAAGYCAADNCKGFWGEVVKIARANFGEEVDLRTLKLPAFKDGDKPKPTTGKVEETTIGFVVVRATSKDKPSCMDASKVIITDPADIYAGCWVRAVLTIAPFVHSGNGVTVYLAGLQKICDDTAFSGRPRVDDVFDEVQQEAAPTGAGATTTSEMPWMA